jgi:hypothetical protein
MRAILHWAFFALMGAMPALAERHALVVGIDGYTRLEPLHKARNDARAVADSLQAAGFVVTRALDPDADALYDTLARFTAALRPGDEVVVYFAGHGVEVEGRNWLLPADMPPLRPGDEVKLRRAALATDDLMAEITARGPQITLMILDACRDNPFPHQGTRSVGNTRGLARLEAPRGSYVIYSAGAGQTALDRLGEGDANPNSVFTRALLPRLAQPGLSIRDLAQQVRLEVDATARSIGHDQFPAIYDQLAGDFVLVGVANPVTTIADDVRPQNSASRPFAAKVSYDTVDGWGLGFARRSNGHLTVVSLSRDGIGAEKGVSFQDQLISVDGFFFTSQEGLEAFLKEQIARGKVDVSVVFFSRGSTRFFSMPLQR